MKNEKKPKVFELFPISNSANDIGYFTRDEILKIISVLRKNYQHLIWFKMLYCFGLTVSDLINLKVSDVDIVNRKLLLFTSNKFQPRVLDIPHALLGELRIECCHKSLDDTLFEGRSGRLHPRTIQKSLEKAEKKTGMNITIPKIRRSIAIHLYEHGWREDEIAKFLGHSHKAATKKILNVLKPSNLARVYPLDVLLGEASYFN